MSTLGFSKEFVDKCKVFQPAVQTCTCCGKSKPLSEFYKQSVTGLPTTQCKTCINVKKSVVRNKSKHGKFISKERIRGMEEPDYTLQDWRDAMVHFGGECCYCGKKEGRSKKDKFDREHLIPISRGGKTTRNNIVGACAKCNRARGNKDLFTWFRAQPTWTRDREMKIRTWMSQEIKHV